MINLSPISVSDLLPYRNKKKVREKTRGNPTDETKGTIKMTVSNPKKYGDQIFELVI
jgi:hypothetical protein